MSCKLSLLLATAMLGGASAGQCFPNAEPGKPCLFECPGDTIHRFDLTPLNQSTTKPYLEATDDSGKSYYFGSCGVVNGVECTGVDVPMSAPVAIQAWSGAPPKIDGTCANLGVINPFNCSIQPPKHSAPASGMLCKYTGGSEMRTVNIVYDCASAPSPPKAEQTGDKTYLITVSGPSVCAVVYTPPLSWGWLTLIFSMVFVILYVGGGTTYNVKVKEKKLTLRDAFPQYHYWKQVPGLVKDGCSFSYEQGQKLYYEKVLGVAAPLEQDLKRRLADNALDSASSGGGT